MKTKLLIKLVLLTSIVSSMGITMANTSASSFAQGVKSDQTPTTAYNKHKGMYVQGGVGPDIIRFQHIFSNGETIQEGLGVKVGVGYQFGSYFGAEIDGLMLNNDNGKALTMVGTAIKGIIPLGSKFSTYGKIGAFFAESGDEEDANFGFLPYGSVGVTYAVSHSVDVGAEYTDIFQGWVNIGLPSANITYHF